MNYRWYAFHDNKNRVNVNYINDRKVMKIVFHKKS